MWQCRSYCPRDSGCGHEPEWWIPLPRWRASVSSCCSTGLLSKNTIAETSRTHGDLPRPREPGEPFPKSKSVRPPRKNGGVTERPEGAFSSRRHLGPGIWCAWRSKWLRMAGKGHFALSEEQGKSLMPMIGQAGTHEQQVSANNHGHHVPGATASQRWAMGNHWTPCCYP